MLHRALPYGIALGAVGLMAAGLGLAAWLLRIPRVESFLVLFVLLVGAIAWRYGRGPAVVGTIAFALVSDYFFIPPRSSLGWQA